MKTNLWGTTLGSVQWFMFMLAGSLAFPIIIGHAYQMSAMDISGFMQRTFLVVGATTLLGCCFGHRLPIADGPAGIWIGVFLLMGQIAVLKGQDPVNNLRLLEGSMLLAGVLLIAIGAAGWMQRMLRVFTPLVNGVFLIILTFQLSGSMLKGMLGVNGSSTQVETGHALIAFGVFVVVISLSIWGKGWMKSYAVLIGLIIGWVVYALYHGGQTLPASESVFTFPKPFAWGSPQLDAGAVISAVIIALVLVSNIIVTTTSMQQVLGDNVKERLERGGLISGVSTLLSSVFSSIATVPFSVSVGFVRTTGQSRIMPIVVACLLFMAASFFPAVYSFFSLLPEPVADAAMLALFSQMVGIGVSSVLKETLDQRRLTILGLALTIGTGDMFLPQAIFSGLPTVLQYIAGNGVLVGILTALILEQLWRPVPAAAGNGNPGAGR